MRSSSSLGMLVALAAGSGCTTIVGLDDVGFTGTGGSGATATSAAGSGGDTASTSVSSGGAGGTIISGGGGGAGGTITTGCGDGNTNFGEECDDGNVMDGDGCSADCHIEPFYQCQNGERNPSNCVKHEVICNDGIDNDQDGYTDKDDVGCLVPLKFEPCGSGQKFYVYKPAEFPVAFQDEVRSRVFVSEHPIILRAAVTFTVTHPTVSTLEGDLNLPGDKLNLFTTVPTVGPDFVDTVLDSTCTTGIQTGTAPFNGCYTPEESFSFLAGTDGHGEWELEIKENLTSNPGKLQSWALIFCVQ